MKILKVAYNNDTKFILDIVQQFSEYCIIETYNLNNRKQMKAVRTIQEDLGTKKLPVISFEDENYEIIGGIWSENNPDWKEEIIKQMKTW